MFVREGWSCLLILPSRVSDAGIRYVLENTPGAHLREVNFTNCIRISDVTLLRMSQRWGDLDAIPPPAKPLSLSLFPSLSCRALGYVCFCYCEHISDTGVELLGHIPSLTSLDLTGCNITDQVWGHIHSDNHVHAVHTYLIAEWLL